MVEPMEDQAPSDAPRISAKARKDNAAALVYTEENTVARVPPTVRLDVMFANSTSVFDMLRQRLETGANGDRPFANLPWSQYSTEMGETMAALWVLLFAAQVVAVSETEAIDIKRAWRFFQRQTSLWFARAGTAAMAGIDRLVREEASRPALYDGLLSLEPYLRLGNAASAMARASRAEARLAEAKTDLFSIAGLLGVQTTVVGTNMTSVARAIERVTRDHLLAQTQHLLLPEYTLVALRTRPDEEATALMSKTVSSAAKSHVELLEAKAKLAELEKSIKNSANSTSVLQRQVNTLKLNLADAKSTGTAREAELKSLRSTAKDNADLQRQVDSMKLEILTLRETIKKNTDTTTAELKALLASAEAKAAAAGMSAERLSNENAKLTADNLTLRAANKGLLEAAKPAENAKLVKQVEEQKIQIDQLRTAAAPYIDATVSAVLLPEAALRALRDVRGRIDPEEIKELKREREAMKLELSTYKGNLKLRKDAQQDEIVRLRKLVTASEKQAVQVAALTTERDAAVADRKAFEAANKALLTKQTELERDLAAAQRGGDPADIASLRAQIADLTVQLTASRSELAAKKDAQQKEIDRLRKRDAEYIVLKSTAEAAEEAKLVLEKTIMELRAKYAALEASGGAAPALAALQVIIDRQAAELKAKRDAKDAEIKRLTDRLNEQMKKLPDIEQIKTLEMERDRARAEAKQLEKESTKLTKKLAEENAALSSTNARLQDLIRARPDIDQLNAQYTFINDAYTILTVSHNLIGKKLLDGLRRRV